MASEHAKKLREVAAQLSTERFQGWANPLVGVITDAADFLDGTLTADTGDAVLSRPAPAATDTELYINIGKDQFAKKAAQEDNCDISAGKAPEDIGELERVLFKALPQWAQDELTRLRAQTAGWAESGKLWTAEIRELQADNATLIHDLNRIKDNETELVNDNAELTARVKADELKILKLKERLSAEQASHEQSGKSRDEWRGKAEALETKLAVAEKALEFYRDSFKYYPKRTSTGINVSEWKPTQALLDDCGETARAVLGGNPS